MGRMVVDVQYCRTDESQLLKLTDLFHQRILRLLYFFVYD